jgi:hypothetical protein
MRSCSAVGGVAPSFSRDIHLFLATIGNIIGREETSSTMLLFEPMVVSLALHCTHIVVDGHLAVVFRQYS